MRIAFTVGTHTLSNNNNNNTVVGTLRDRRENAASAGLFFFFRKQHALVTSFVLFSSVRLFGRSTESRSAKKKYKKKRKQVTTRTNQNNNFNNFYEHINNKYRDTCRQYTFVICCAFCPFSIHPRRGQ